MMNLFRVFHRTLQQMVHSNANTMLPVSLTHRLLVVLLTLVLVSPPGVQGFGVCRSSFRCLNGGIERYGTSIFSPCRCQCMSGYTGPRCQYREAYGKRSTSLNALNQLLQDRLQQERGQQQELVDKRQEDVFDKRQQRVVFDKRQQQDDFDNRQQGEVFFNYNDDDDDYGDNDSFAPVLTRQASHRRMHPRFFRR